MPEVRVDVVIVGGGLVGATLALALAHHELDVLLVDAAPLPATQDIAFDGRASAIAAASVRLFEAIGVWRHLDGDGEPIREIRVVDGLKPPFLHFDASQGGSDALGLMVENRQLRRMLMTGLAGAPRIRLESPARLEAWRAGPGLVTGRLSTGIDFAAPLLVAADGRGSAIREQVGIRRARWRYAQTGIVTTIHHEAPHGGVAHEIFLPEGPLAILPLTLQRSSIVWTARNRDAPAIMALPDPVFLDELSRRTGGFLGALGLAAPRWSYPLSFHHAERYVDARVALVGDAAHGIHPIAGQGLNLGARDVAALAEVLVEAVRLGLDIGDAAVLERYQRWRRPDNVAMCIATDSLNRLFSNDAPGLARIRRLGLGLVNRITPAKLFFMRQATGETGALPRLMRGAAP